MTDHDVRGGVAGDRAGVVIDRIRAQYTGTHRCDPPGSVADDMRTLITKIERLRSALDGPEHDASTINRLRRERDEARAEARSARHVIAVLAKRAGGRIDITRAEVLALHPHGVLRDVCEGLVQPGLRLTYEEPADAR